MKTFIRENRGQALIEMALVLPILILLVMGIVEFGRLFAGYLELQHVTREATRYASVQTGESDLQVNNQIQDSLSLLDYSDVTTVIDRTHSEWIEIRLTYPMEITTPVISDLIGSPVQLRSRIVMHNEGGVQ